MKKIISVISVLALALLISSASAQNISQVSDYKDKAEEKKNDPIIVVMCMPFPSCEKDSD